MTTEITKTYQVQVTIKKISGGTITEDEINVADMRADIKQRIAEVTNIQRGDLNCIPGTVSES
ncbi:MAG: hypothetical protein ACFFDT_20075 [Candidatus Hodarchaeota archaeon]